MEKGLCNLYLLCQKHAWSPPPQPLLWLFCGGRDVLPQELCLLPGTSVWQPWLWGRPFGAVLLVFFLPHWSCSLPSCVSQGFSVSCAVCDAHCGKAGSLRVSSVPSSPTNPVSSVTAGVDTAVVLQFPPERGSLPTYSSVLITMSPSGFSLIQVGVELLFAYPVPSYRFPTLSMPCAVSSRI